MTVANRISVVAGIFIVFGLGAVLALIGDLFDGNVTIGTGILSFLIGVCLLLQRPLWRRVAMVLLAIGVAFVLVIGSVAISNDTFLVNWFGTPLAGATRRLLAAVVTLFFLVLYGGMFWVLVKEDVRAAFEKRELAAG